MTLSAIVSSSASSSSASASSTVTSLLSPVGLGVGGIVVAVALVLLLAYFDVLGASEEPRHRRLRPLLAATILPLALSFAGVVVFKALVAL